MSKQPSQPADEAKPTTLTQPVLQEPMPESTRPEGTVTDFDKGVTTYRRSAKTGSVVKVQTF